MEILVEIIFSSAGKIKNTNKDKEIVIAGCNNFAKTKNKRKSFSLDIRGPYRADP
jgi:hypothetical protein